MVFLTFCNCKYCKYCKTESFENIFPTIITKDDAINYLSNYITHDEAIDLYTLIFANDEKHEVNKNIELMNVINNLSYVNSNEIKNNLLLALCTIINHRGIYNNLPWFDGNALTVENIKTAKLDKLKYMYEFSMNLSVDPVDVFNHKTYNYFLACDMADIIKFNTYNTDIKTIILRHKILNAYEKKIYDLFGNMIAGMTKPELIEMFKNENLDTILLNLKPNDGDYYFIDHVKKSIKNVLFTYYNDDITFDKLCDMTNFNHNKKDLIDAIAEYMDKLILYNTANVNYTADIYKQLLLNDTLYSINNEINNIRYDRDVRFFKKNIMTISTDNIILQENIIDDLMCILYKKYKNISKESCDGLFKMVMNNNNENNLTELTKLMEWDNKIEYIALNINNVILDQILMLENVINIENVPMLMRQIKSLIILNHKNVPFDLINQKITKCIKIGDLSDILFYGII